MLKLIVGDDVLEQQGCLRVLWLEDVADIITDRTAVLRDAGLGKFRIVWASERPDSAADEQEVVNLLGGYPDVIVLDWKLDESDEARSDRGRTENLQASGLQWLSSIAHRWCYASGQPVAVLFCSFYFDETGETEFVQEFRQAKVAIRPPMYIALRHSAGLKTRIQIGPPDALLYTIASAYREALVEAVNPPVQMSVHFDDVARTRDFVQRAADAAVLREVLARQVIRLFPQGMPTRNMPMAAVCYDAYRDAESDPELADELRREVADWLYKLLVEPEWFQSIKQIVEQQHDQYCSPIVTMLRLHACERLRPALPEHRWRELRDLVARRASDLVDAISNVDGASASSVYRIACLMLLLREQAVRQEAVREIAKNGLTEVLVGQIKELLDELSVDIAPVVDSGADATLLAEAVHAAAAWSLTRMVQRDHTDALPQMSERVSRDDVAIMAYPLKDKRLAIGTATWNSETAHVKYLVRHGVFPELFNKKFEPLAQLKSSVPQITMNEVADRLQIERGKQKGERIFGFQSDAEQGAVRAVFEHVAAGGSPEDVKRLLKNAGRRHVRQWHEVLRDYRYTGLFGDTETEEAMPGKGSAAWSYCPEAEIVSGDIFDAATRNLITLTTIERDLIERWLSEIQSWYDVSIPIDMLPPQLQQRLQRSTGHVIH